LKIAANRIRRAFPVARPDYAGQGRKYPDGAVVKGYAAKPRIRERDDTGRYRSLPNSSWTMLRHGTGPFGKRMYARADPGGWPSLYGDGANC